MLITFEQFRDLIKQRNGFLFVPVADNKELIDGYAAEKYIVFHSEHFPQLEGDFRNAALITRFEESDFDLLYDRVVNSVWIKNDELNIAAIQQQNQAAGKGNTVTINQVIEAFNNLPFASVSKKIL